jgi:hypothetical protein
MMNTFRFARRGIRRLLLGFQPWVWHFRSRLRRVAGTGLAVLFLGALAAQADPVPPAPNDAASGGTYALFKQIFRPYEPDTIGLTWDKGDGRFLDYTLSVMFPLAHNIYPGPHPYPQKGLFDFPGWRYLKPYPYAAATLRGGQYIGTRNSAPVVGKRFNPLFAFRFWTVDSLNLKTATEGKFFEVLYAHESNGQWISSEATFNEQVTVFLHDGNDPAKARLNARDSISRGWDYVGTQYGWESPAAKYALRLKFNYYLEQGIFQKDAEQYASWEGDPEGRPRKFVDGVSARFTVKLDARQSLRKWGLTDGRFAVTWNTGYVEPFRFNTWKFELGFTVLNLPFMGWYRTGYNSDLTDYYRKDHSAGIMLSFWNF